MISVEMGHNLNRNFLETDHLFIMNRSRKMFWLITMILILITIGLFSLLLPLSGQLIIQIKEEATLEMTFKLLFIPVYTKTLNYSNLDLIEDYIKTSFFNQQNVKINQLKKIKLKELTWFSEIGLEDASDTALSVSGLMLVKGFITQLVLYYLNSPKNFSYRVKPNFDQLSFESDCRCMFSIRLGQAIYMKLKR